MRNHFALKFSPMPERSMLRPDERRAFVAFAGAARAVLTAVDRDLERDAGMPRAYYEILHFLDAAPTRSLRMSELAEATRSQASRISHAVGRLEEAGHVRRELCAADRRGWFAVLTDEGKAALDAARPCFAESVRRRYIANLSATERDHLTRIGEALLADLDAQQATDSAESAVSDDPRPRRRPDGERDRNPQGALTP